MEKAAEPMVMSWRRSSYSGDTGGECVEVAGSASDVTVRDSKRTELGQATMSAGAWRAFVSGVSEGSLG